MFTFLFYLFVALQVAALVGGVVTRAWPLHTQRIVWRGTAVEYAARQMQALLYDVDDVRFAYPTGQFVPDANESDHAAGRVVMHEANFKGSKGLGMIFHLFALAASAVAGVFEESLLMGFLMASLTFGLVAMLTAPFLLASIIDIVYRRLYRSRIEADVRAHPELANAVTVDLMFRGLSAFGIVGNVMRAAAEPAPPAGSKAAGAARTDPLPSRARASTWARAAEQRSTVLYASGVAAALLMAIVLTLASPFSSSSRPPALSNAATGLQPAVPPPDDTSSPAVGADGANGGSSAPPPTTDPQQTTPTAQPPDPGTYTSTGGGYSIVPPAGWLMNAEDKDHGGVFYETRWHKRGASEVHALVDYTPGYSGTPLQGASQLRDARKHSSDYEELDFSAQADGARRWEFVAGGQHVVDTFYRCGETGIAVLATAPPAEWDAQQAELSAFQSSFSCTANGAGTSSGAGSGAGRSPSPTTSTAAPAPAPADGQTYPLSTHAGRMERAIRHHWKSRLEGDYATAYGFYTGAVRRRVGLESTWAQQISKDGLEKVEFGPFHQEFASSSGGRLRVAVHTESREGGCDDWQFTYDMVFAAHRWLITDSKATDAPC
ncbi:MAG: hypothetical protein QOD69_1987 [Solirubrobacteraceae bacterium]|nr:hypothetical protein [Solirubrobacteraceae bacterium]